MKHAHIRERLDNWARWSRMTGHSAGATSMTGIICDRLKRANTGTVYASMDPGMVIDQADAELVERAWRTLMPKQQQLLRWVYVRNANPGFVCRRLGIKPWPASVFAVEVAKAERAIDEGLRRSTANSPV